MASRQISTEPRARKSSAFYTNVPCHLSPSGVNVIWPERISTTVGRGCPTTCFGQSCTSFGGTRGLILPWNVVKSCKLQSTNEQTGIYKIWPTAIFTRSTFPLGETKSPANGRKSYIDILFFFPFFSFFFIFSYNRDVFTCKLLHMRMHGGGWNFFL